MRNTTPTARSIGLFVLAAAVVLACAGETGRSTREPPPKAGIAVTAVPHDAFVSPFTNTPWGGSHVIRYQGQISGTITKSGELAVPRSVGDVRCRTPGRLQATWHQPVWAGSVQAHERARRVKGPAPGSQLRQA